MGVIQTRICYLKMLMVECNCFFTKIVIGYKYCNSILLFLSVYKGFICFQRNTVLSSSLVRFLFSIYSD